MSRVPVALVVSLLASVLAHASRAGASCPRFSRCEGRPLVYVERAIPALIDGDGNDAAGMTVTRGVWSISACTAGRDGTCTLYRRAGNIYEVRRADLVNNSRSVYRRGSRTFDLLRSIRRREAPTRGSRPSAPASRQFVVRPVNVPDRRDGTGYDPPDGDGAGSNESLSCRGPGCDAARARPDRTCTGTDCIVWSVTWPTGRRGAVPPTGGCGGRYDHRYWTGYAAFALRATTPFVATGRSTRAARWMNPADCRANADALWREGWVPVGSQWARVWVLASVTPDDRSVAPFVILRSP